MGGDFIFCLISTVIDVSNYLGSKFGNFIFNILLFIPLIVGTIVLLLWKRKKQCIAAGFLYLIGGVFIWLFKIIYFIYLIISEELDTSYTEVYGSSMYLVSFLINLLVIFFRLGSVYLIKVMFPDIENLEDYIHEKEHAELIQSLATKGDDDKLVEDDEITEENLYKKKNNPFITGREKKEENEEEEINFETTL